MIVPDVNLLVYAHDSSSPVHAAAVAWWQECMSGSEPVGLPAVVIFGFVRVTTHARVFRHPLTAAEAAGHVRLWLEQPVTRVISGGAEHAEEVLTLLEQAGTAGNLVTDAQIAALALEHGAVVHTTDGDFTRFPGLRWRNPLTGMGATNPPRP